MATYVLIPGAGGDARYWRRVTPLLRERGHDVIAIDLPADDDGAGLDAYADEIDAAIGDRTGLIVVGHSMGALSATLVAARREVEVERLILTAPMIPRPGETGAAWWENTGQEEAARAYAAAEGRVPDAPFDPVEVFLHDLPLDVRAEAAREKIAQSGRPFADPWPLERWPDVETHVVACRRDRLFPLDFMRRVAKERLGIVPDEIDAGHLVALSQPQSLVERFERYRQQARGSEELPHPRS